MDNSQNVYETPKAELAVDSGINTNTKRPTAITIVCAIGFFGALITVPLIFSDIAKSIGAWYPPYLAFSAMIGAICFIGMWKMKKLGAYLYAGLVGLNQIVMLATGIWSLGALLLPGIVVAITLYYSKSMN